VKPKPNPVLDELRKIANRHRGLLRPEDVVKAAKSAASPLHRLFTWNDRKCGVEYRLWQARELCQQYWIVEPSSAKPIRMFISVKSARKVKGGGYQTWDNILSDPDRRQEWIEMALDELEQWEKQYGALSELSGIFAAISRARNRYTIAA